MGFRPALTVACATPALWSDLVVTTEPQGVCTIAPTALWSDLVATTEAAAVQMVAPNSKNATTKAGAHLFMTTPDSRSCLHV
jgi:hypothetical protein